MLLELHVENLLLIERADVEFSAGFNTLTGETGAGKSLLLDALDFLLGARGDASMVRSGAEQAEVSARVLLHDRDLVRHFAENLGIAFEVPKEKDAAVELVLSRSLPRSGRARAHANGRPIALPALRWLGERLVDIHGQHENQSLLRPATRLEILDRFASAQPEAEAVRKAHAKAADAARELAALRRAARERQGREDMMRFQLQELTDAKLDDLEPQSLEGEVRLLRGAEKIRAAALSAGTALDGDDDGSAAAQLARALKGLHSCGEAGPETSALVQRLETILEDIRDAAREAEDLADKARSDPERLADLEDRRQRLRTLERKHGRDLGGLLQLRESLAGELANLQQIDARTQQQEQALAQAISELRAACEKLSRKRRQSARDLEKKAGRELTDLGLKGAQLQLILVPHKSAPEKPASDEFAANDAAPADDESRNLLPVELHATGAESAELLFSANAGLEPRPLKECASGGEMSRVMLAIKNVLARVSGADRLPVVVFDEIDAGVGGRLGAILGKKLAELAAVRQVLCITHQPQIAAFAQRQFKVEKQRIGAATKVSVRSLEGAGRVAELATMLRGDDASERTRKEAEEMLKEAQRATR